LKNEDAIIWIALGVGLWFFWKSQNPSPGTFSPNSPGYWSGMENEFVPLTVSSAGRQFIKQQEGFKQFPSQDVNNQTIGYGHTVQAGENWSGGITRLAASNLLDNDLSPIEDAINNALQVNVNQNQFDAMASLAYNIGIGAFLNSTLLKLLNQGNYSGASQQFAQWVRSAGAVNPTLQARRTAEQNTFNA
jgi:lysozyme